MVLMGTFTYQPQINHTGDLNLSLGQTVVVTILQSRTTHVIIQVILRRDMCPTLVHIVLILPDDL
jgi:hypothetical protein